MSNAIHEYANSRRSSTASLDAANTFCAPLSVRGDFNLSISGTWSGTLTAQRSWDGLTWVDVETFTSNAQKIGTEPEEGVMHRIGFKTSQYSSGTAVVRLSK